MVMMKLVYITILMIWRMYPLTCAEHDKKNETEIAVVAQPGCKSECGNVSIPYPFGMEDPKCYGSSAFEIECRNNKNKDVAYLKYINLEVILIDIVKATIWIKNPIYSDGNCERRGGGIIKLEEGPFVYSQDYNSFVGVGCGKAAFMYLNSSIASVCVSMCYDNTENDKNKMDVARCRGAGCCETSLPPYLSEFNISIGTERDVEEVYTRSLNLECAHALIRADYNKFPYDDEMNRSYWAPTLAELDNANDVPAVLEWEITNRSLLLDLDMGDVDVGYQCNQTNVTSSEQSGSRCTCKDGFQGNPYIQRGCKAKPIDPDNKKKSRPNWAVIGVSSSLGTIILFLTLWCLHKVVRKKIAKKRKEKFFKQNGGLLLEQRLYSGEVNIDKLFSLKDLEKATDYFNINRVLGKGGQGTVYKGMLVDGNIVAVKKFKVNGKVEEFINEFAILSQINHRNVVKLLGCCLETETPLLVYEFIPNGNLYEYLHGQNKELSMTWAMRLRIATEIAGALFYLHSVASQPIYHRDIKSTNILLDGKYKAKVADFGASRMVSIEATHLTTAVQGTFGYLDPEYFHTSQFTDKSDVYSFGVVLVELLTGKKPISSMKQQELKSLASYFVLCVEENRLFDIIDERVMNEGEKEHIIVVANLARRCLELNGRKRPTMKEVTLVLESIQKPEKQSNAQEYHEELEFAGFEDSQFWTTYSTTSNSEQISDSIASTLEIMPILIK